MGQKVTPHLECVVENLMLVFLHAEDRLKHVKELLAAHDRFGRERDERGGRRRPRPPPVLRERAARGSSGGGGAGAVRSVREAVYLVERARAAAEDDVELVHPGGEHRVAREAVDLGQRAQPPLDVHAEDLAQVVQCAAALLHERAQPVRLEEHLHVAEHRVVERLVGQDGQFAGQERVEAFSDALQLGARQLWQSSQQICRLFGVERVGDTAQHEDISVRHNKGDDGESTVYLFRGDRAKNLTCKVCMFNARGNSLV